MGHIPNIVACALLGATRHRHLRLIKLKFETFLLHVHCAVNCCWIAMSRGQWSAFGLTLFPLVSNCQHLAYPPIHSIWLTPFPPRQHCWTMVSFWLTPSPHSSALVSICHTPTTPCQHLTYPLVSNGQQLPPPLRWLTKSVNGALRIHTLKEVESSQLFHQKFLPPCLPFFLKKKAM